MWLDNIALVLPDRLIENGALRIEDGLITEITERPGTPSGLTAFPGFIDMHGDMIELELEPRPGVDFPMSVAVAHLDARLAASGVTTAYAGVSFSRGVKDGERRSFEHTSQIIRALKADTADLRVDHRIHARFDITYTDAIAALEDLLTARSVDLVSVMDHTPGQGQFRDVEGYINLIQLERGVSAEEARAYTRARIETATPTEVILQNLHRVSDLCRAHGVALASHDDDTVEKAHLLADLGTAISEFPVTLAAAEAAVSRGLMTAMGAPNALRGQSTSGNLTVREAHAAGLLHILAADYHPAAILPAILKLAESDPDGLPGATRLATANPAKALGLSDRGEIALGKRADLSIADPNGRIALTLRCGVAIHDNGTAPALRPLQ